MIIKDIFIPFVKVIVIWFFLMVFFIFGIVEWMNKWQANNLEQEVIDNQPPHEDIQPE